MKIQHLLALTGLCFAPMFLFSNAAQAQVELAPLGRYSSGVFNKSAAEISAYDPESQSLFVTNAAQNKIDVLTLSDPTQPTLVFSIDLDRPVNSVAFHDGVLAAAIEGPTKQDLGQVVFFDRTGKVLKAVTVGALPDMLTFTPDGMKLVTANEGEPSEDYRVDPEGSVSVIDLAAGVEQATVKTLDFRGFNDLPVADGVRVFGLDASVAQDLEPEYIAVSADSQRAWVTLQENNAIAVVDLKAGKITDIIGLGFKDHSLLENRLDASNKDDAINIAAYPNLYGVYQPDVIAAYEVKGKTYLVTANEGDSRVRPTDDEQLAGVEEGDIFNEESRVAKLELDPVAFPDAATLQDDAVLGRLKVMNNMGDTDGDGDYDQLYAFGGRSFSIWDASGKQVFDSGSQFEFITAAYYPEQFNSNHEENGSFDDRSDDKGPEPEGVTLGQIGDRQYAFIGLERISGIMVYDITDPMAPFFVNYANSRDFGGDAEAGTAGDLGPEGLLFIPAAASPNGKNLLVVTYEVSGTVTVYEIKS